MIRLLFAVLIVPAFVAAVLGVNPWVLIVPIALLLGAFFFYGGKLRCPSCGKRIKLGYTACHHCGRSVMSR